MKTAYMDLIRFAIKHHLLVSVWDGEEWQVKKSSGFKECVEAVKSVELAELRIRDEDNNKVGWASVSAYGLLPEETVIDHTTTPFMTAWANQYYGDWDE